MRNILVSLPVSALLLAQVPAFARTPVSAPTAAMAVVQQWLDAFNTGNKRVFVATCADQMSIIDEFPPYTWQGARACQKYWSDFAGHSEKEGLSDAVVKFSKPYQVERAADNLYLVGPASLTFSLKGRSMEELGAVLTVILHKGGHGWKITGWAWASPK